MLGPTVVFREPQAVLRDDAPQSLLDLFASYQSVG